MVTKKKFIWKYKQQMLDRKDEQKISFYKKKEDEKKAGYNYSLKMKWQLNKISKFKYSACKSPHCTVTFKHNDQEIFQG